MAIATGHVVIYCQIGIEDLELPESLDLVVWVKRSGLCGCESLCLQRSLFSPNPFGIRIVRDDALKVKFLPGQDARQICRRNHIVR
jgi:hypothetical protein